MATRSVTAALTHQPSGLSYPSAGTWYAEVGDQIQVTVTNASGTALSTWGEVANASSGGGRLDAASGTSQSGTSSATFLSTAIPSAGHGTSPTIPHMHFFSPTGGGAEYSGRLYINVPNPIISASANVNSPTALVPVTLTVTTTHTKTGVVMTKSASEPYWNTQNPHVYTYYQARNASETYYAGLYTSPGAETQNIWRGVTSAGTAPSGTFGNGVTISAPGYIQPNTSNINLSSTSASVSPGATFNLPTVSTNYTSNEVIYMTTSSGSTWASNIVARTISNSQLKDNSNQSSTTLTAPSSPGTTVYYLFSHRHANYGGPATWQGSLVDSGAVKFTLTVTAATSTVAAVDEGTVEYFYTPSGTGGNDGQIRHYVQLANTQTGQSYKISTSSSSLVTASGWIAGTGGTVTRTPKAGVTDQTDLTTLQGDGTGQKFYIWRDSNANDSTATVVSYDGAAYFYKRKFLPTSSNAVIPDPDTLSIAYNATTTVIAADETRLQFDYVLKDSSTGTSIQALTRTDTGADELGFTIGNAYLPSTSGTTRVYSLWHRSPCNVYPNTYIDTGDTTNVYRLKQGEIWTPPGGTGEFGFQILSETGIIMLDSNKEQYKHVTSGSTSEVTAGSDTGWFTVSGSASLLASDIVAVAPGTASATAAVATFYPYWAEKNPSNAAQIKIHNKMSMDTTFVYQVIRK